MGQTRLCRSAALTGYADLARSLGLDPLRLAAAAGVPAAALTSPDLKIPSVAVGRMLEAAAKRAGAADFGLRLAETRRLSNMGALALIAREQPTLRKALQVMAQYQWLQNEAVCLTIEEAGDAAVLKVSAGKAGRGTPHQAIELSVGVLARNVRALVGERWRPELVYFQHAAPASLVTHRRVFGVKPLFDQSFDGLAFARETLDAPLTRADPEMARQIARYIEQIAAAGQAKSARDRVEELIALLLPTGTCSIKKAAQHLGVDRRTVHRRLAAQATTFSALVDDTRRRLATPLLTERNRPVQEVARSLGFSSTSAFSRWFRQRHARTARSLKAARTPTR
jgi:AraC-like DNA-binding protein